MSKVNKELDAQLEVITKVLHVLSNKQRLRVVQLLVKPGIGELTVTQIYQELDLRQAVASKHLITLRDYGVLQSQKKSTKIYYSIKSDVAKQVVQLINQLLSDV